MDRERYLATQRKAQKRYNRKLRSTDHGKRRSNLSRSARRWLLGETGEDSEIRQVIGMGNNEFIAMFPGYDHDTWHIDHIIPAACFDHSDENQVQACWSWWNLQLVSPEENHRRQKFNTLGWLGNGGNKSKMARDATKEIVKRWSDYNASDGMDALDVINFRKEMSIEANRFLDTP